jgi:hypothetical protein
VTTSWTGVLDECAARLDAAASALERGEAVAIAPFVPGLVPGPMPAELADRARALVERSAALERRLEAEQARLRDELRRLPRMPAAEREVHFEAKA